MSALGRLAVLLQRTPLELNAEDIADALWLATLTGPVELRRTPSVPDPPRAVPDDPALPPGPGSTSSHLPPAPLPHPGAAEAVLATEQVSAASVPFRSPTAAAIPDALALGRALRPLRRRVPSPTRSVLDENATATFVADASGRLWLPVLRPAMSRWLDLELVVEDSPSMRLWSRTIAELELLFQFNGAFRNTSLWRLTSDGPVRLFSGRDRSAAAARDHRELLDSSGRRAIVIVSDCVSAAWYDGTLAAWLAAWVRRGPVAVLQVLPQRLWTRTALRRGLPAMFSASTPGVANERLSPRYIAATPAPGDDVIALPVMTLEATSVAAWARTVAGLSGTIEGVALPSRRRQTRGVAQIAGAAPTATARVARFRETSTAPAKLLASCLAAVPINLPIVRLVRAAAVPEARDSDLAELFLGGLLREVASDDDPDRVEYDFHAGVRELLLDFVPTGKALYVLDRVSAYIEPRIGQTRDFPARLTEVTEAGASFAQRHRSFALLAARVFERLGDDWSDDAARLQHQASAAPPGRDAGTAGSTRFFDEKAAQYEQTRRQLPSGRNRTAILDALIDDVVRHAQRHAVAPGDILALYATRRDGGRVVALGGCVGAPHAALVTTISDAIGTPRSRFEQWWALRAARVAVDKLGVLRAEPCVVATLGQLEVPNSFLNQRPDGASTTLAETVVDEFQRAIGVSSARSWIDAGEGRQGTGRCVAILGSDPAGTHREFSQALGARLAAHGWKIVAGGGDNVGPVVIESFIAAGGPAGEATLYSSNMFESRDSMRRHMIASADAAVIIAGGDGTAVERDIARSEGIPVVAVGFTGGTAGRTTAELLDPEDSHLAELVRLLETARAPSLSAEIALRLLHVEVRDRPKASTRNDSFKLHEADGIRQWLIAANRARDDEILDLINIFATRRQRTWLVAMPGRVLCVLDDLDTRRKGRLVQFTEVPDRLVPIDARANNGDTGVLQIGQQGNWHYSTALFPDPQQLVIRTEQLIAETRRVPSSAEQPAYRPSAADVDRDPAAALPFPVIAVAVEGPGAAAVLHALRGVRGIEFVTAQSRARFTIVAGDSSLVMLEGEQLCATPIPDNDAGRAFVAARLERWAKAEAVRNLATQDPPDAAIDVTWGRLDSGRLVPLSFGARIHVGDRIYVTFSNRSDRPLYVGVFDIGIADDIRLLTVASPQGHRLAPGESATLGTLDGDDLPRGLEIAWSDEVPAMSPRRESVIVIAATCETEFSLLESRDLATRKLRAHKLEVVLDRIREPGMRDLGSQGLDREGFCVHRIDFELSPAPRSNPMPDRIAPVINAAPEEPRRLDDGTDFALVIGIDHYPHFRSLSGAATDAERFRDWLCDPHGGCVAPDNVRLLRSRLEPASPLQDEIDEQIVELWRRAESVPRARRMYFYFSGHASTTSTDDVALLLPLWSVARSRLALSVDQYRGELSNGPFEELVCFFDVSRHADARALGLPPTVVHFGHRFAGTRIFLAYATEAGQPAFEAPEDGRWTGVFTQSLLAVLRSADRITASDLKRALEYEVALHGQRAHVINGLREDSFFGRPRLPTVVIEFERARGRVLLRDGTRKVLAERPDSAGNWELALPPGLYRLEDSSGKSLLFDLSSESMRILF